MDPQLLSAGLLDRLTLMISPLVLGSGKRLFGEGTPARTMTLVNHKVSSRGNVIATYEPSGDIETGSFQSPEPSEREQRRQEQMRREEAGR